MDIVADMYTRLSLNFQKQSGNALFLILIAIALFAALSYAITRSGKGGSGGVSKEQAKLHAKQLLDFSNSVRHGVQKMTLMQGLSVESIDYSSTGTGTSALFSATGGGVTYVLPPAAVFRDGTVSAWNFDKPSAGYVMPDASNTTPDGIIWLQGGGLTDEVCKAINQLMGHPAEIPFQADMSAYRGEVAFCYREGAQQPELIYGYWMQ